MVLAGGKGNHLQELWKSAKLPLKILPHFGEITSCRAMKKPNLPSNVEEHFCFTGGEWKGLPPHNRCSPSLSFLQLGARQDPFGPE